MFGKWFYLAAMLCITLEAQAQLQPIADPEPVLRLETGGPTAYVTSLAFSPDGKTLYAGGLDKVVHVWNLDPKTSRFVLDSFAYRVPIGPGTDGAINAIAVSPDGDWLAVGGMGVVRGGAGFREPGLVLPAIGGMTPEMRQDQGTIYLFNTKARIVRMLRGHAGTVLSLAFAPAQEGKPAVLVSAAQEWDAKNNRVQGGVRVWNVGDASLIDRLEGLPRPELRPGLAVSRTGQQPKDLKIILAWGDGRFRLWNVAETGEERLQLGEAGVARSNITAAALPNGEFVLGTLVGRQGQLQWWTDTKRASLPLEPPQNVEYLLPRALCLVSSRQAAVVVGSPAARGSDYRLRIIDLARRQVVGRALLWQGDDLIPAIATDANGRFLAVGGNRRQDILIYTLPLANEPAQVLKGVGTAIRTVSFATNQAGETGLILDSDKAFDFAKRRLTSPEDWKQASPAEQGWQIRHAATEKSMARFAYGKPGANQPLAVSIKLEEKQAITSYALLPPIQPGGLPVLAVAIMDFEAGPLLSLYSGGDGKTRDYVAEQVRQLKGHSEPIRHLAASPDGKLLVSAADDQTICVWSLADLDQVLGVRGLLKGVAVAQVAKGPVVVGQVHEGNPAAGRLSEGDIVEGIVRGDNRLEPVASPRDFYNAISRLRPGDSVKLRIKNQSDIRLPVGQGIDERKPLLSLFCTQPDGDGAREWLAWSPIGPYDSSSLKAEKYLGWHFNSGKPEAPTAFALADQYRAKYYRPGILKHLIHHGDINQAIEELKKEQAGRKLPRPALTVWLDELKPDAKPDQHGHLLARQSEGALKLAIDGLASADDIESATWQLNDRPPQKFSLKDRSSLEFSAPLFLDRGVHKIRVTVRTREAEPKDYHRELTVRHQPAPPKIESPKKTRHETVPDPKWTLPATVTAGQEGQGTKITLRRAGQPLALVFKESSDERRVIEHEIDRLKVGDNLIELIAVNDDALKGFEEFETARLSWVVSHTPKEKVPPPQIVLETVEVLGSPEALKMNIEPGRPVVVSDPQVRITGKITAAENIAKAEWTHDGSKDKQQSLTGFEPGKKKEWGIRETIRLSPGPQKVSITAASADGDAATTILALEYRPRLPELVLESPAADTTLYEGEHPSEITLKGRLTTPKDAHPFTLHVRVNDKEIEKAEPKEAGFAFKVPLQPGRNRVQLKLENRWKATRMAEATVRYLRPPRILQLTQPPGVEKLSVSRTDVAIQAQSPTDLPLRMENVRLTVNGRRFAAAGLKIQKLADDEKNKTSTWLIQAPKVELDPGKNQIVVNVRNSEAEARKPGEWQLTYDPPKPAAKAAVEILRPRVNGTVTEPEIEVQFAVRSETPLKRVEVMAGALRLEVDTAKVVKQSDGSFDLKAARRVPLEPGANVVQVIAANDAGPQEAKVTVSYAPLPVRMVLEEPAAKAQDGRMVLPICATGETLLKGHVLWHKSTDEALAQVDLQMRVYVNGFQQRPVELGPRNGNRREFEARVLLTRAEDNRIEIELPGVASEAGQRQEFYTACAQPQRPRTLHLLIVGVGETDAQKLTDRVLQTLTRRRDLKSLAFDRIADPVVLSDEVMRGDVFTQLQALRERVRESNDVMMIYWVGREAVTESGSYLLTTESQFNPNLAESAIKREALTKALGETLGARVVLFDVTRTTPADIAARLETRAMEWPEATRIGLLGYAWLPATQPPLDARLAAAFDEALAKPSSISLGDVAETASRIVAKFKQGNSSPLAYHKFLPAGLEVLAIGQKP